MAVPSPWCIKDKSDTYGQCRFSNGNVLKAEYEDIAFSVERSTAGYNGIGTLVVQNKLNVTISALS